MLERNFNLSFRMTRELGRAIVCGDYMPSASLPTEAELCEKFGVSRTAVREAVKMLSAKGLISSKPRQGIRILPREEWNIYDSDLLSWLLEGNPSREVLVEFLEMRIAVEPEAAALAATRATQPKIAAIGEALERMRISTRGSLQAREADIDFHIAILYASDNRFYVRMRDFVRTALKVSIAHTTPVHSDYSEILEEHAKVYRAIARGDAKEAYDSMQYMVEQVLTTVRGDLQKIA